MSRKSITAIAMAFACASSCLTSCSQKTNDKNGPPVNVDETSDLRIIDVTIATDTTQVTTAVTTTQKPTVTTTSAEALSVSRAVTSAYIAQNSAVAVTETTSLPEAAKTQTPETQMTVPQDTELQAVVTTTVVNNPVAVPLAETVESVQTEAITPVESIPTTTMSYSSIEVSYLSGINGYNSDSYYEVQYGDCRSWIAEKNYCNEEDLIDANPNYDWNYIMPGDYIKIPSNVSIMSSETSQPTYYTVMEGDCLSVIAERCDCYEYELINANPNYDFNWIEPGDVLVVPSIVQQKNNTVYNWDNSSETNVAEATPIQIVAETEPVQVPVETIPVQEIEVAPVTECTTVCETPVAIEVTTTVEINETPEAETTVTDTLTSENNTVESYEEIAETVEESTVEETETNVSESETETNSTYVNGEMPENIMAEINRLKQLYPGIEIAMGIYSLDGSVNLSFNEYSEYAAGCTVKAAYALYVLEKCEELNIDIWLETIEFRQEHINYGSGDIRYLNQPGQELFIGYLLQKLLSISDNTAYNVLLSKFPLTDFQNFLWKIGGQNLYGVQYGVASVNQRKNEWFAILDYINSERLYSRTMESLISNTPYCYLCDGMSGWHSWLHKSGWADESTAYTCAADCAVVDGQYLVIVITQDYSTGVAHTDAVRSLGAATETYMSSLG